MHGQVIPVLRKKDFNYSFLVGSSIEYVIANAVSVAQYNRIGLSVRVHAATITGSPPGSFQFVVRGVNPSPEDGRDFVLSGDLGSTASLTASTSGPGLGTLSSVIEDPQTPFIRVVLVATSTATAPGGSLYAQLSADLKLWMA